MLRNLSNMRNTNLHIFKCIKNSILNYNIYSVCLSQAFIREHNKQDNPVAINIISRKNKMKGLKSIITQTSESWSSAQTE
jgi:hypothetical protein